MVCPVLEHPFLRITASNALAVMLRSNFSNPSPRRLLVRQ